MLVEWGMLVGLAALFAVTVVLLYLLHTRALHQNHEQMRELRQQDFLAATAREHRIWKIAEGMANRVMASDYQQFAISQHAPPVAPYLPPAEVDEDELAGPGIDPDTLL